MADVSRNSECTIAASAAKSGEGGCFVSRDSVLVQPFPVKINMGSDRTPHKISGHFLIVYGEQTLRQSTTLFKRAWVLQEGLLSRRSLYFGESQLFWECRSKATSETFRNCLLNYFKDNGIELFRNMVDREEKLEAMESMRV